MHSYAGCHLRSFTLMSPAHCTTESDTNRRFLLPNQFYFVSACIIQYLFIICIQHATEQCIYTQYVSNIDRHLIYLYTFYENVLAYHMHSQVVSFDCEVVVREFITYGIVYHTRSWYASSFEINIDLFSHYIIIGNKIIEFN